MCGRYASAIPAMDLATAFGIRPDHVGQIPEPSYNVAPTDPVPAVLARSAPGESLEYELRAVHWGLVPWWSSDLRGAARRINARVETAAERPAYRSALVSRRCVLPATGYYEWSTAADGRKQPYFLRRPDGGPLALAGVYERWRAPSGEVRWTCAMLTTAATGPLAALHHRTPMVLPRSGWDAWLDPAAAPAPALRVPIPATGILDAYPVSPQIGNVRATGSQLITPLTDAAAAGALRFQPVPADSPA